MRIGYAFGDQIARAHQRERVSGRLASAFLMAVGVAAFTFSLAAPSGNALAADSARARSKTRAPAATLPGRAGSPRASQRKIVAQGGSSRTATPTRSADTAVAAKAAPRKAAAATSPIAKTPTTKAPGGAAASKTALRTVPARDSRRARGDEPGPAAREGVARQALARLLRNHKEEKRSASGVKTVSLAPVLPARPTIGQAIGLHDAYDPLSLHSSVALVQDSVTGEVLFEKNARAVLPIASISKLMTAMVVLDARLPLDEVLEISEADIDTERFSRSRLRPGTQLTRGEMLNLALMSSENRAANALGRHYPGGLGAFVARMNAKAVELGMPNTRFVEPTGLSSSNVSNGLDLARMVKAASAYPLIRDYSTATSLIVDAGARPVSFRNTNRLVDHSDWEIRLQKTGYISEAGNCMVMQTGIDGRPVVMVLLDADGATARTGDAQRLRQWLEGIPRHGSSDLRALAQPSRGS